MVMKGISPLIAAVMLILFTMIIAGIMAAWATSFVTTKTENLGCIGALTIDTPTFDNGRVSVRIRNVDTTVELEGLKAYLFYTNASNDKEYTMVSYGVADPLSPGSIDRFTVDTGDTTKPLSIEVVALSCPKGPASAYF